jgi:hypothetical protein
MIIKIPVYFDVDEHFKPEETEDFVSTVQGLLTQDLIDLNGKKFSYNFLSRKIKLNILTSHQVRLRITGAKPAVTGMQRVQVPKKLS